jgi:putative oxidoreductase
MNALCHLAKQYGPLTGRILLAFIFIMAGFNKIPGFTGTAGYIASKGLPMSEVLAALTIAVEIGGGIMLVVGWNARWAAAALAGFCVLAALIFHPFWTVAAASQQTEMIMFMKNLAIAGGLLQVVAFGPGPFSLKKENC